MAAFVERKRFVDDHMVRVVIDQEFAVGRGILPLPDKHREQNAVKHRG